MISLHGLRKTCGQRTVLRDLIWSSERFPVGFRWAAMVLPLTHANIATRDVMLKRLPLWATWPNLLAMAAIGAAVLVLLVWVGRCRARE